LRRFNPADGAPACPAAAPALAWPDDEGERALSFVEEADGNGDVVVTSLERDELATVRGARC